MRQLEEIRLRDVWARASEIGISDRGAIERMVRLHLAAMRGLAIEMVFTGERERADRAMELLDRYIGCSPAR